MRAGDGDSGSASVEIVLLTPVIVVLVGVAFFAGRLVLARQVIGDASRSALEAAVIMPDAAQATDLAASTVEEVLRSNSLCSTVRTSADVANFSVGGTVAITVTCIVDLPSLAFLPLPRSVTLSATCQGPVEPYREFGP